MCETFDSRSFLLQRIEEHRRRHDGAGFALAGRRRDGKWAELKWTDLLREIEQTSLHSSGGELVITDSDNTIDDLVEMLAAMTRGLVHCPIDDRLPADWRRQRASLLRRVGVQDRTCHVLWTSGSSGTDEVGGRGVCLSHDGYWRNAAAKLSRVPQDVDDVRLTVLPISHAYARTCDIGTWLLSGCRLVITRGHRELAALLGRYRPTHVNAVPKIAHDLLNLEAADSIRVLGVGGASLAMNHWQSWNDRGVSVVQGYGLTETGPVICSESTRAGRPGCVGHVVDGWQIRSDGETLAVRGPSLMLGYVGQAESPLDAEGFFDTGDRIEFDDDAVARVRGRRDSRLTFANGVTVDARSIEQMFESELPVVAPAMLVADAAGEPMLWTNAACPIKTWSGAKQILGTSVTVRPFDPPLRPDELTVKGTLRRGRVQASRGTSLRR